MYKSEAKNQKGFHKKNFKLLVNYKYAITTKQLRYEQIIKEFLVQKKLKFHTIDGGLYSGSEEQMLQTQYNKFKEIITKTDD